MAQTMVKDKIDPLDLFADRVSPEVEQMMTKVAERSTRLQLDAIDQYESAKELTSEKFLQASIKELTDREKHLAEAYSSAFYRRASFGARQRAKKLNPKFMKQAALPVEGKIYTLAYKGASVQILEDADKNITVFRVSSARLPGLKRAARNPAAGLKKLSK
ncbi:hypothetical protein AB6T85_13130 [Erwinia sp. ACCC 02193]|jgi:hypothetical protein|uniref:Uncharacterized protein n=1 Tax=Erwinia aeris TaxID=3239803 RepID=A0ABV4E935_9GAMM